MLALPCYFVKVGFSHPCPLGNVLFEKELE